MPISLKYKNLNEKLFDYPYRIFISGSSQSGKTTFAEKLLQHGEIFKNETKKVIYCHPDYLSHRPVEWHKSINIPIVYQSGIPTLKEICDLDAHTCIVLDDLYHECINSSTVDYLLRVLSGKKIINVIILSQRFFESGKYGLSIRNNCNYLVLMRNVDAKLNTRVAALMCLKEPIEKAIKNTESEYYIPQYIFIDSTPRGQVSSRRCYINIFDQIQIAYCTKGMKAYILSEQDFLSHFTVTKNNSAIVKTKKNTLKNERKSPDRDITYRMKQRSRKLRNARKLRKTLH